MKKILFLLFTTGLIFSCNQASKENSNKETTDPYSGVITSRDAKAQTLLRNMNLFANADFSYVDEFLTEDFTLKTAGDTAVAATGKESAIEYWNGIHTIYDKF